MIKVIQDSIEIFEASNSITELKFYKQGRNQGKYEITFKANHLKVCLVKDCYSVINLYTQDQENLIENASYDYFFESKTQTIGDNLGNGLLITFTPLNSNIHKIFFEIQFKIYEKKHFILVKLINIKYNSNNQFAVHSISPLTVKKSILWLSGNDTPTNLQTITWFKNGWQSWSPCKIFTGNEKDNKGPALEIFNLIYDNQDYKIEGKFYSEYCTVITDVQEKNSLILGFVTLKDQFTRIIMDYENLIELKLLTAFGCLDGVQFKDSSINSSEELFICFKTKNLGYYGLIDYAKIVKAYLAEERTKSIPIGWCSWYYYFTNISENDMIRNLEFFKINKEKLPIDFIQLDDGYVKAIGDYDNINSKFPNGLAWLFEKIKNKGFKGGIWTAPFFAVRKSNIFKNHKDWFLKRSNKLLKTCFNWNSSQFSLDLTNNHVLRYLSNFFTELLFSFKKNVSKNDEAMIEFFKIDFLYAAVPFGADYKDKTLTRAQLYHNGVKIIRDAITEKSFLLGCGAPLGPCVGLVDSMRISEDTAPLWENLEKTDDLRGVPIPGLKEALLNVLYRSFMHKYFWINDPDCLMIRRTDTKLSEDEIKLQLTIFGLSGGQILISDDMTKITNDEIEDAKQVIPPYNPNNYDPIVVDAFTSKLPSIYMLEAKEVIGKRYLVALINWENNSTSKRISISEMIPNLSYDGTKFYIYDFWNQKFIGAFRIDETIEFREINPHSCKYLNIIPVSENLKNSPILLSTSLHVCQGCCEIREFKFAKETNELKISIELIGKRKGFLMLKLPKNTGIVHSDFQFTKADVVEDIWKIFVEFKDRTTINIKFD